MANLDMPSSSTDQRRRTLFLALLGASVLALLLTASVALYGFSRIETAASQYRAELDRLRILSDGTRDAQVDFKTQVQEWKNILLRGHDPVQFERFLRAFMARNEDIQRDLARLIELARAAGLPVAQIIDLRERHQELVGSYKDGLSRFRADDPMSVRLVDELLRGLDRTLNTRFDRFAATVQGFSDASVDAFTNRMSALIASTRALLVACAVAGLVLLAACGALILKIFRP